MFNCQKMLNATAWAVMDKCSSFEVESFAELTPALRPWHSYALSAIASRYYQDLRTPYYVYAADVGGCWGRRSRQWRIGRNIWSSVWKRSSLIVYYESGQSSTERRWLRQMQLLKSMLRFAFSPFTCVRYERSDDAAMTCKGQTDDVRSITFAGGAHFARASA